MAEDMSYLGDDWSVPTDWSTGAAHRPEIISPPGELAPPIDEWNFNRDSHSVTPLGQLAPLAEWNYTRPGLDLGDNLGQGSFDVRGAGPGYDAGWSPPASDVWDPIETQPAVLAGYQPYTGPSGGEINPPGVAPIVSPPGELAPLDRWNYSYPPGSSYPPGVQAPVAGTQFTFGAPGAQEPYGDLDVGPPQPEGTLKLKRELPGSQPVPLVVAQEWPTGVRGDLPSPNWPGALRGLRVPSRSEAEDWLLNRSGDIDLWARGRLADVQAALAPHAAAGFNRVFPAPESGRDEDRGSLDVAANDLYNRLFPEPSMTPGLRPGDDPRYWARDRGWPGTSRGVYVPEDLWGEPPVKTYSW